MQTRLELLTAAENAEHNTNQVNSLLMVLSSNIRNIEDDDMQNCIFICLEILSRVETYCETKVLEYRK
jgi:hypothetical protein